MPDELPRTPPPLGSVYFDPRRTCTRLVGGTPGAEVLCDKSATVHVDWGEACGFVCADHEGDLERWTWHDKHLLGPCCGMPGALWWGPPTSTCAYEDGGLPTTGPSATERTTAELLNTPAPTTTLPPVRVGLRGVEVEGDVLRSCASQRTDRPVDGESA